MQRINTIISRQGSYQTLSAPGPNGGPSMSCDLWFYPSYPGNAFLHRLIFLHAQVNKRLVTMSVANPSGESSKREPSLQRSADGSAPDSVTRSNNDTEGENDQAGRKFTEEEVAIHILHREACEVRRFTSPEVICFAVAY